MKKYLFLFSILSLISCENSENKKQNIASGFINKPGLYYIFSPSKIHRNIILKEFKDGTLIFAIRDSKNKILFQQNLNESFSKFHYWSLYVDINSNIWWYNSDYSSTIAVLYNEQTNLYEETDFCQEKLILPKDFKEELNKKNTFNNCKSMNE